MDPRTIGRLFYYFFHRANTRLPERTLLPEEMTEGIIENNTGYMTIEQLIKHITLLFTVDQFANEYVWKCDYTKLAG